MTLKPGYPDHRMRVKTVNGWGPVVRPIGQIQYQRGHSNQFQDVRPGTFSFTLRAEDGVYTPMLGAYPMREGAIVVWEMSVPGNTLYRVGVITGLQYIDPYRWNIVCTDVLGVMNRDVVAKNLYYKLGLSCFDYYWPMSDPQGSPWTVEAHGITFNTQADDAIGNATIALGGKALFNGDTSLHVTSTAAPTDSFGWSVAPIHVSIGTPIIFGFWFEGSLGDSGNLGEVEFFVTVPGFPAGPVLTLQTAAGGTTLNILLQSGAATTSTAFGADGSSHYFYVYSDNAATASIDVYMDGAHILHLVDAGLSGSATLAINGDGVVDANINHLGYSSSANTMRGEQTYATVSEWFDVLFLGMTDVFGSSTIALDATLSEAAMMASPQTGQSMLAIFNDLMRGEQGRIQVDAAVTNFATSIFFTPTLTIKSRATVRSFNGVTSAITLDASNDLDGLPIIDRSVQDRLASLTVTGPITSVTITEDAVKEIIGDASGSDQVQLVNISDLTAYGRDRLARALPFGNQISSVVVDVSTMTANPVTLFGLNLGDVIHVHSPGASASGFPAPQDFYGYLLGVDESYQMGAKTTWTLYLQDASFEFITDYSDLAFDDNDDNPLTGVPAWR